MGHSTPSSFQVSKARWFSENLTNLNTCEQLMVLQASFPSHVWSHRTVRKFRKIKVLSELKCRILHFFLCDFLNILGMNFKNPIYKNSHSNKVNKYT